VLRKTIVLFMVVCLFLHMTSPLAMAAGSEPDEGDPPGEGEPQGRQGGDDPAVAGQGKIPTRECGQKP
jgi:hypothetical protein